MGAKKNHSSQAELCQTCKTGVPHACGRIFCPPYNSYNETNHRGEPHQNWRCKHHDPKGTT